MNWEYCGDSERKLCGRIVVLEMKSPKDKVSGNWLWCQLLSNKAVLMFFWSLGLRRGLNNFFAGDLQCKTI